MKMYEIIRQRRLAKGMTQEQVAAVLGLNSTNFTLEASDDALVFHTTGYGHGVGLSQYGARELALEGKNFSDILKWYYQGTEITIKS